MSGDNKVVYQNLNPTATMPTMANGMLRNPLKTITLAAADIQNGADWDTVVAATSGITGDKVINYERIQIAAGTIATANATYTLGSGTYIGQIMEFVALGTLVTNNAVVTVTDCADDGYDVFTMANSSDSIRYTWTGVVWVPSNNESAA